MSEHKKVAPVSPGILREKIGNHFRFRQLEFWAERGMIHILAHDVEPSEYTTCPVRDFLQRLQNENDSLGRIKHADERREFEKFVEDGIACCRQAKNQGRPDVAADMAQLARSRRRGMSLPTPSQIYEFNKPGPLPLGRFTGRTT